MSVSVSDPKDFYFIHKALKININWLNELYVKNQQAYDLQYDKFAKIDSSYDQLNKDHFDYYDNYFIHGSINAMDYYNKEIDMEKIKDRIELLEYNLFDNNGHTLASDKQLKQLDVIRKFLEVRLIAIRRGDKIQ